MMKKNLILIFGVFFLILSCTKEEVIEKYDNGASKLVYLYKEDNGKKIKVKEIHYYDNKQKRIVGGFDKDGNKTGEWVFYFSTGDVFAKADFTNNEAGSKWIVNDNKAKEIVSLEDRVLSLHFAEDNGLCDIKVKKTNGEVFYKFFEDFSICQKINTIGNIQQGESISWYENGQINSIHYYKDGMQDSLYQVFTKEGGTLIKGQYKMGKKIGKWEYFLSDGTPQGVEIYDVDGILLKPRQ
jgi:antitoxin component YwqK of YwqJK toxin-antitoxin module